MAWHIKTGSKLTHFVLKPVDDRIAKSTPPIFIPSKNNTDEPEQTLENQVPVEGDREDIQYYDECDTKEDEEAVAEIANAMSVSEPTNVQPAPVSELDLISDKIPQTPFFKVLFKSVLKMHNNNIPNLQVESYMQDLNEALEIQGAFTAADIECNESLIGAPYKPTGSGEFCNGRVYDYDGSKEMPKLVVQKENPYCSMVATLKNFFLRRGFADKIVEWKDCETVDGYYLNLYDAPEFSQFKTSPNDPTSFVLSGSYNLLLTLNDDWFSSFEATYNIKYLYLAI
ncbi:hypothetical protein A0J61_11394 [Choanephora cucurbitarum]|uniref:Uncharacterized protein n=1 Tax=Choanephora cucurbitarum TaxID=101091 RepID=A0A1C7MUX4_9FUNG|nr:hypothetical protein A0J61_11394 [Choanephora cucurbitarum]